MRLGVLVGLSYSWGHRVFLCAPVCFYGLLYCSRNNNLNQPILRSTAKNGVRRESIPKRAPRPCLLLLFL